MAAAVAPASAAADAQPPPRNVAVRSDTSADLQQPSLAVDPTQPAHVAIAYVEVRDATVPRLRGEKLKSCGLSLSTDGGSTWRGETLVGDRGRFHVPEGFAACWNPQVAFGPRGELYCVVQSSLAPSDPFSHVLIAVSPDGGRSFPQPPHLVDPGGPAYAGPRGGGDWWPQLAVEARGGTVAVAWSRTSPVSGPSQILVATSGDGGRTFAPPSRLSSDVQVDVTSPRPVGLPGGGVDVAWLDYTQWAHLTLPACPTCAQFYLVEYRDRILRYYAQEGARLDYTQGAPGCGGIASVDVPANSRCDVPAGISLRALGRDGTARDLVPPAPQGVGLGCPRELEAPQLRMPRCSRVQSSFYEHHPFSLAAGPAAGQLASVWWDFGDVYGGSPGLARLHVALSGDGARTWEPQEHVGVPAGHADDDQHHGAVSVAPGGRVDVAYYDTDPAGSQDVYRVSAAWGRSLDVPVRVSDSPSSSSVGPRTDEGRAGFGEHLGLASTSDRVLVAWTDTREGLRRQAIYFASAPLAPASSGRSWWPAALPAAAAVLVAVAATAVARRMMRAGRRRP